MELSVGGEDSAEGPAFLGHFVEYDVHGLSLGISDGYHGLGDNAGQLGLLGLGPSGVHFYGDSRHYFLLTKVRVLVTCFLIDQIDQFFAFYIPLDVSGEQVGDAVIVAHNVAGLVSA